MSVPAPVASPPVRRYPVGSRHVIVSVVLIAIIAGGGWFVVRTWQQQQRRAMAVAAVPALPSLDRWPRELVDRMQAAATGLARTADPARPLGELAQLFQANGFSDEATLALQTLRTLEPANPRWPYYLADLRLKARATEEARRMLLETVKIAPGYLPAQLLLAEMLVEDKRYDEARDHFEQARALAPDDPRPTVGLAFLDGAAGRMTAAIAALRRVLQSPPQHAPAHHLLALLLDRTGDAAGAAEQRRLEQASTNHKFPMTDAWIEALGDYCYDANRLHMLAFAHTIAGEHEACIPILQHATRIAPKEAALYDSLAGAYEELGRLDEARTTLETGIQQAPDNPELPVRLAAILSEQHQPDDALVVLTRALERWPEKAEVQAARGHVLLIAGRPAESVDAFQAALSRNSALTEAHLNLGRAYVQLRQLDAARASFERAVAMRPDYPDGLQSLLNLAGMTGDFASAEKYAEKLVVLQPGRPDVRRTFADILLRKANRLAGAGNMADAEIAYRRGIDADPGVPLLHAGLGMVCVATGRMQEAIPHLQRYVQTAPDDPEAYLMLGNAQRDAGQSANARATFTQGIEVARMSGRSELTAEFERLAR